MRPPELVPHWDESIWKPVREAWDGRGLELPPSPAQRSKMWPAVRDFSDKVGNWVAEAPHETSSTFEIVQYVLLCAVWERKREGLFDDLTEEERQAWLDIERTPPGYFTTSEMMRRARVEGVGLPETDEGENPYRVMLLRTQATLERRAAEAEAWRNAEAKRPHVKRLLEAARDDGSRLIDIEAELPAVVAWGERTGRLIEAAVGAREAVPFLDQASYIEMHVKGFYPFGATIRDHSAKLSDLIGRIDPPTGWGLEIEARFDPDEWSVWETA